MFQALLIGLIFLLHSCEEMALEWLASLRAQGSCNLLGTLKAAIKLPDISVICVVLCSL